MLALLGLLVSALVASSALRASLIQSHRDAGGAEAIVLDQLHNAADNAIFESMVQIQRGEAISRNGSTVNPKLEDGELVWRPTVNDLVAMGYLPSGWAVLKSPLNDSPYEIEFRRVPKGCLDAACNIDGHVVLAGALRDASAAVDGALVGPILSHLGAVAGVSLLTHPTTISGYGGTWELPNPVAGQPAGVIAVRIGTAASEFGQYVRMGDSRDPDLAGNLTVAGNTVFGSGQSTSEFRSSVLLKDRGLEIRDGEGRPCIQAGPAGRLDVACQGLISAQAAAFSDGAGQAVQIGSGAVTASGSVEARGGFHAAAVDLFEPADPAALVVRSGEFSLKDGQRHALLSVSHDGVVSASGGMSTAGKVQAGSISLTSAVEEGDACQTGDVGVLHAGGLAVCQAGTYRATTRYASFGSACGLPGAAATDPASGDTLICRQGYYASLQGLLSSRVFMASFSVAHGSVLPASVALPQGCPASAGPVQPQAAIYLLAQTDANNLGNPVVNRNAQWNGSGWTISMTDGTGTATASLAIAEIFCIYP